MVQQDDKAVYMRERRDRKVYDHLLQYAPVWLRNEEFIYDEDAIQFQALFYHPRYGWTSRRYFFDSFNNVLYYKGQLPIEEDEALALQETDPYISAPVINTVDSYGG